MIIGITGKSGSGKTTITDLLNREDKYEIIHVDDITHLILELDEVKELLISKYGEFIKDEDNNIDRKKLGSILFQDNEKMTEYNQLIYLYIERHIDGIIASTEKDIIIDWMQLPLSKYFAISKLNILVDAPLEIRIKRLLKRDGVTEEYLLNREKHAVNYDKESFDYIIINDENDMDKKIEEIEKYLEGKKSNKTRREIMKNICFYAGSFDPFTVGHLHVVKNASIIYDKVIIGIGTNEEKVRNFDKEEMKKAIEETLKQEKLTNVDVVIYEGLTVDIAKKLKVTHFIRGIRNGKDYEYEKQVANYNLKHSGIRTLYIGAEEYEKISSTVVREKLANGESIDSYVPEPIKKLIIGL